LQIRYKYHDLLGIVESMLKLGAVYQQLEQQDRALTCFEGSLAICQQLHCLPLSLQAYYFKASAYFSLGRYKEGLAPARTAVDIGLRLKQSDWLARAYYILGSIYNKTGDIKASINCHIEAAKLYQEDDDNPFWIEILIGLGDFLLAVPEQPELWERALNCYRLAINVIEKNQQLEYLAPALGKIARAFLKVKGLDGVEDAARCYRLQLQLAGDLESTVLPVSVAVALRVEALTGIQVCASLRSNPSYSEALDKLIGASDAAPSYSNSFLI
jgi:tetratricopeptide (TPR) repeat protein